MDASYAPPAPIEQLARELGRPIQHYLERYVGDPAVAQELCQETLLRMHEKLYTFAGRSSIKTWAFSIAGRIAADYLRQPGSRARIVELDAVPEPVDSSLPIEQRMIVDEMNSCVRAVIDSLPAEYRAALVLHDLEGLSAQQTAEVCDCSVEAAKMRIHRARLRLQQALKGQCDFYRDPENVFRCDRKARAPAQ